MATNKKKLRKTYTYADPDTTDRVEYRTFADTEQHVVIVQRRKKPAVTGVPAKWKTVVSLDTSTAFEISGYILVAADHLNSVA